MSDQAAHRLGFRRLSSWQLWRHPPIAIVYHLGTELAAIAAIVIGFVFWTPTAHELTLGVILLGLGILQAELTRHVERTRRSINTVRHVDLSSVWTFAALLLLPPGTAYAFVLLLYVHLGLRSWIGTRAMFQQAHGLAAIVVTAPLVQWLFHLISPVSFSQIDAAPLPVLIATAVAAFAYSVIDMLIVAVAVWTRTNRDNFRRYALDFTNQLLDLSTNCIGAFVALALVYQPWFVVFTLVPVLVIHRSVLVKELEDKAIRDQKTGLLNATAWNEYANRELARAERLGTTFGLLMVDLDHFKHTNDTYGHIAGDNVLIAVAEVLRGETRRYDSAGRFGGEEFAVLLPESNSQDVAMVAERIRIRVSELSVETESEQGTVVIDALTASLGVAVYPSEGTTVEALVQAADAALYTAKRSGRNRVIGATLHQVPEPGESDARAS